MAIVLPHCSFAIFAVKPDIYGNVLFYNSFFIQRQKLIPAFKFIVIGQHLVKFSSRKQLAAFYIRVLGLSDIQSLNLFTQLIKATELALHEKGS